MEQNQLTECEIFIFLIYTQSKFVKKKLLAW